MGPSEKLISNKKQEENVTMVRMVKAKEETMNTIGEEAGNPIYRSGLIVISSSDIDGQARNNLKAMESAYNVFTDEYSNRISDNNTKHDIFTSIFMPLWKIATNYYLTGFFYKYSFFSTNELTSLYHFADSIYNRSPVIEWMQYKVLSAPSNLPQFGDEEWNGKVMTGILAEKFKWGKLSDILKDYKNHWAVTSKTLEEEKLIPLDEYQTSHPNAVVEEWEKRTIDGFDIISKDGVDTVRQMIPTETLYGYKLYKNAVLLWTNIYRNQLTPVYMKREDRTRHHYMIGKSGTWKSVFLQTMARQDLWNGDGICLIDPHGDLAEDVLSFVPKERAKDVVYFDAGNEDRPMGLNLYEINSLDEADRTVNDATEIFLKMFWPEIFGPRIQEYFKYGSLTILEDFDDRPTLLDVVRLFTDETYREIKTAKVTNAVVKNWWERTYNSMGDREKAEIIPFIQAKFWPFTTGVYVRNIIGQSKSAFKMYDAMQQKKIILMNLAKGISGEETSKLIGKIIAMQVKLSALKRAKIEEKDRVPHYLYVDEFQNYVSQSFESIMSEARKYRLGLVVAHQYTDQLKQGGLWGELDLSKTIFGNIGNMFVYKVGAPDAEFLAKEFEPEFSQTDLTSTEAFMGACKISINNQQTRPFSFKAKIPYVLEAKNPPEKVQIIKQISSLKRGTKRELVDKEIYFRIGV